MARIGNSIECTKCELDLFDVPPTNTSIDNAEIVEIEPTVAPGRNGDLEFIVRGTDSYIDLNNTLLYLSVGIEIDNEPITIDSDVGLVNNFASSLFDTINVQLKNESIENSNKTYAYRAYIEDILNYNYLSKSTILQQSCFYKDDPGRMDVVKTKAPEANQKEDRNNGMIERRNRYLNSGSSMEMTTKLHSDIFNSDRYLLNNIDLTITLSRNKPNFPLLYTNKDANVSINIHKAILIIRRVNISPTIMTAHNFALERYTAKYPIKRVLITSYSILSNLSDFTSPTFNATVLPCRVVVGLVEDDAYNGKHDKNPYNFQHFDVTNITLSLNSNNVPYNKAISMDYKNNRYSRAYQTLFDGSSGLTQLYGQDINYFEYANGYCFYVFNIAPDLCNGENFNLLKKGALSVVIKFASNLKKVLRLIIYHEYDNMIEINKLRNISKDYAL